jgi:hypothetical protein
MIQNFKTYDSESKVQIAYDTNVGKKNEKKKWKE